MSSLNLLHITDPHLYADADREIYGVTTDISCRAVVKQALEDEQWQPDAILVTGDIAEDCSQQGYERFKSIFSPLGIPVLCLPGNHDDPEQMQQLLNEGNFSFCTVHDFDSWRIVLLDSHVPGKQHGFLSESELERVQLALEDDSDRSIMIAVHHQPVPMGSAWLDEYSLHNGQDLMKLAAEYPQAKAVIWGHVHQEMDVQQGSLKLLCTPSTCAQFTPQTESCVMDTRPPGFRRLTLEANGEINTTVHWLQDWVVSERPPDSRIGEDQS